MKRLFVFVLFVTLTVLLISGCRYEMTVEAPFSKIATAILNPDETTLVPGHLLITIPSDDECESYAEEINAIVDGLGVSVDVGRCLREEGKTFIRANFSLPIHPIGTLIGEPEAPVAALIHERTTRGLELAAFFSRFKGSLLLSRLVDSGVASDPYNVRRSLEPGHIRFQLTNDTGSPYLLLVHNVFLSEEDPIGMEPPTFTMSPNKTTTLRLSNLAVAHTLQYGYGPRFVLSSE